MGRPRRNYIPGALYLVRHTGNKRLPVYLDDEDNENALQLLVRTARRYRVEVLYFSQVHHVGFWLFRPASKDGISNLMRDMQGAHSRYLNGKYAHRPWTAESPFHRELPPCADGEIHRSHNWVGRYEAFHVPDELVEVLGHYIETAPEREGECQDAAAYPWSSAPARLGLQCHDSIARLISDRRPVEQWASALRIDAPEQLVQAVERTFRARKATITVHIRKIPRPARNVVRTAWTPRATQPSSHGPPPA